MVLLSRMRKMGKRTCLKRKMMSSEFSLGSSMLEVPDVSALGVIFVGDLLLEISHLCWSWRSLIGSLKHSTPTVEKVQARPVSLGACVSS